MKNLVFILSLIALSVNCVLAGSASGFFHEDPTPAASAKRTNEGPIECMTPFVITIGTHTVDVSQVGFYHNLLMDYGKNNKQSYNSQGLCTAFVSVQDIANAGMGSIGGNVALYISSSNNTCSEGCEGNPILALAFSNASTGEYVQSIQQAFSLLLTKGGINAAEKQLLDQLVNDLAGGANIDFCTYRANWESIPNKPYNGAASASLLSIAAYSLEWWDNYANTSTKYSYSSILIGGPLADLAGAAWGYGEYMYDNWSHHYEEDFGMNALKAGGREAVKASLFALF